jgi:hypothetical protein
MDWPFRQEHRSDEPSLIAGDALKAAALKYAVEMRIRVETEQGGLLSVFDGWFTRVVSRLLQLKREALHSFLGARPGAYLVNTRLTDNFGRNTTCAADSIFVRVRPGDAAPAAN